VVVLVPAPSRRMSLQRNALPADPAAGPRLPGHQCRNPAAGLQRVPAALGLALGLRKIYLVTLTLTLLLAIFAAIASAFLIASDLAKPLLLLAEGTKAVAEGNLATAHRQYVRRAGHADAILQHHDAPAAGARTSVERNRAELENAKAYLESVLANMSAGVMVLDGQFNIVSANDSVRRILGYDFSANIGTPLQTIESQAPFAQAIIRAFSEQLAQHSSESADGLHWQRQFELSRQPGAVLEPATSKAASPTMTS
jgi:nitrogen fixation/metabolism regulation signal transduction histidine kinase